MSEVEFYFDLSSPWTYLAFHNIQPIVIEAGAHITWRPFLLGGVFNAVNSSVYADRQENPDSPKMRAALKSLFDWAEWSNLELNFPSPFHPARSVNAMRMCCALENDQQALYKFATAAFDTYFVKQNNLDDFEVLADVADSIGKDGEALVERANTAAIKTQLRNSTQEVIDRGGFGSPSIFVNGDDMYFGNDQLPLVKRALRK